MHNHLVVGVLVSRALGKGDVVLNRTLAYACHSAGCPDVGNLAVNKTVARYRHVRIGVLEAVVDPGTRVACELDRTLGDLVALLDGTGIITDTLDGQRNLTGVLSVGGVLDGVVDVLDQNRVAILDDRFELLVGTVVHNVLETGNLEAVQALAIDGQRAEDRLDLVVVGARAVLELVVEPVLVIAGQDVLAVVPGVVLAHVLTLGKAFATHGNAAPRDGLAVVVLVAGIGGQRDLALGDGQLAVLLDLEHHVAVVRIRARKVLGSKAHVVATGVGALDLCRATVLYIRDVALAERGALGQRNGITGDRVRLAVVLNRVGLALDGHDDLVGIRVDGERGRRELGHDVLAVRGNRVLSTAAERDLIFVRTGVGGRAAGLDAGERSRVLARGVARLDRLRLAVIGSRCVVSRERHVFVVVDVDDVLAGVEHGLAVLQRLDGVAVELLELDRCGVAYVIRLVGELGGVDQLAGVLVAPEIVDLDRRRLFGPRGRDGHVVVGHGELSAALDGLFAIEPLDLPTRKVIALARRLGENGVLAALVDLIGGRGAGAQATAVEVVDHLAAGNVLGVEVDVGLLNRVGQAHGLGQRLIGAPRGERIGNAADRLGRRVFGGKVAHQIGNVNNVAFLSRRRGGDRHKAGLTRVGGIVDVVGNGIEALALDNDLAVDVVVPVPVVTGELVGNERDGLDVLVANGHAGQLFLDHGLVLLKDIAPVIGATRDGERSARAAVGPRDHTVGGIVALGVAVIVRQVLGRNAREIDLAFAEILPAALERVEAHGRIVEVVELGIVRRGGHMRDRHVVRVGEDRLAVFTRPGDGYRGGTLSHAGDLAVLIDRQHLLVARRPCIRAVVLGRRERGGQIDRVELLHGIGTVEGELVGNIVILVRDHNGPLARKIGPAGVGDHLDRVGSGALEGVRGVAGHVGGVALGLNVVLVAEVDAIFVVLKNVGAVHIGRDLFVRIGIVERRHPVVLLVGRERRGLAHVERALGDGHLERIGVGVVGVAGPDMDGRRVAVEIPAGISGDRKARVARHEIVRTDAALAVTLDLPADDGGIRIGGEGGGIAELHGGGTGDLEVRVGDFDRKRQGRDLDLLPAGVRAALPHLVGENRCAGGLCLELCVSQSVVRAAPLAQHGNGALARRPVMTIEPIGVALERDLLGLAGEQVVAAHVFLIDRGLVGPIIEAGDGDGAVGGHGVLGLRGLERDGGASDKVRSGNRVDTVRILELALGTVDDKLYGLEAVAVIGFGLERHVFAGGNRHLSGGGGDLLAGIDQVAVAKAQSKINLGCNLLSLSLRLLFLSGLLVLLRLLRLFARGLLIRRSRLGRGVRGGALLGGVPGIIRRGNLGRIDRLFLCGLGDNPGLLQLLGDSRRRHARKQHRCRGQHGHRPDAERARLAQHGLHGLYRLAVKAIVLTHIHHSSMSTRGEQMVLTAFSLRRPKSTRITRMIQNEYTSKSTLALTENTVNGLIINPLRQVG